MRVFEIERKEKFCLKSLEVGWCVVFLCDDMEIGKENGLSHRLRGNEKTSMDIAFDGYRHWAGC